MTSIDSIILQSINPFENIRSINFWDNNEPLEPSVDSIHQEAIATIETTLEQVIQDRRTRTVLVQGDGGSGKTYLLGRLKKKFNNKAFFAYIPPFTQSDYIWRHILRHTINSLLNIPEGQKFSQLTLWFASVLSRIKQRRTKQGIIKDDIFDLLRSDRRKFINKIKDIYSHANIYNADIFFGVLHDLTKPELRTLACEWLRGDELSEESLQSLGVKKSIATEGESAAREILANFCKIANHTKPIVLCFDQLESIARLPNGSIDLQTLFNVNSKICDEDTNFLILIGITTQTWRHHKVRIDKTHQARIFQKVDLKEINLEQSESLLKSRLYHLHRQASPKTDSAIYPIEHKDLKNEFPGGKANPRNVLILGKDIFQQHKDGLVNSNIFKVKWNRKFSRISQQKTDFIDLSSKVLIKMLKEVLIALDITDINSPLSNEKFLANCSLSYKVVDLIGQVGIIWTEDENMSNFYNIMRACQDVVNNYSLKLYLIRKRRFNNKKNKGYRIYSEIFTATNSPHSHIIPDSTSFHYIATYYNLVKDSHQGNLFIGAKRTGLQDLRNLTHKSRVFQNCSLLNNLGITQENISQKEILAKNFILDLVTNQHVIGRNILVQNTSNEFTMLNENKINQLIQQLCEQNRIRIINPTAPLEAQSICLIVNR
ncbi:MAG: ATP-binding protein [Cyanobacteria bacterium J06639_18]